MTTARLLSSMVTLLALATIATSCVNDGKPQRRTRAQNQDAECRDADRPFAFVYPSTNREFGPDDPKSDRCELLVPDHIFCCPKTEKPTDR